MRCQRDDRAPQRWVHHQMTRKAPTRGTPSFPWVAKKSYYHIFSINISLQRPTSSSFGRVKGGAASRGSSLRGYPNWEHWGRIGIMSRILTFPQRESTDACDNHACEPCSALLHRENVLLAWRARGCGLRLTTDPMDGERRTKKHCCACGRYSLRLCLPAPSPFPAPDKPTPICANSHPQFWLSSGLASIGGRMRRSRRRRRRRRRPHCTASHCGKV